MFSNLSKLFFIFLFKKIENIKLELKKKGIIDKPQLLDRCYNKKQIEQHHMQLINISNEKEINKIFKNSKF